MVRAILRAVSALAAMGRPARGREEPGRTSNVQRSTSNVQLEQTSDWNRDRRVAAPLADPGFRIGEPRLAAAGLAACHHRGGPHPPGWVEGRRRSLAAALRFS